MSALAAFPQEHGATLAKRDHLRSVSCRQFEPQFFGVGLRLEEKLPRLDDPDVHVVGPENDVDGVILRVLFEEYLLGIQGDASVLRHTTRLRSKRGSLLLSEPGGNCPCDICTLERSA